MHPQSTIRRFKRRISPSDRILRITSLVLLILASGLLSSGLLDSIWPNGRVLGMHPGAFSVVAATIGLILIMSLSDLKRLVRCIRGQSKAEITRLDTQRRH